MVEFRADEKTAEKLTEIADTLDISRSDLLLSMVKFALTNHQWARFGLTHKTLPRYEENPMATKKFSPAQIAAQKLFAQRARAGTLGKTVKRKAVVKRNPVTKNNLPDYRKKTDEQLQFIMKDASEAARAMRGLDARAEAKYLDQINDASTVLYERAAKFRERKTNPDKSKPRAYVKRVSQATGAPPSKRLVTRRKKALTAPAGYFPNPGKRTYEVFCQTPSMKVNSWTKVASFFSAEKAKQYAKAYAKSYPSHYVRVESHG